MARYLDKAARAVTLVLLLTAFAASTTEARSVQRACNLACEKGLMCKMKGGRPKCMTDPNYQGDGSKGSSSPSPLPLVTCAVIDCTSGYTCMEDPLGKDQPRCVPLPTGPSCMTIKCSAGYTCQDLSDGSRCVRNEELITCANMLCALGFTCVDYPGTTKPSACIPQNCTLQCQTFGGHCEIDQDGNEICVPNYTGPTCASIRCKSGYTCQDNIGLPSECVPEPCSLQCQTFGAHCERDESGNEICVPNPCELTCATGQHCELLPVNQPTCVDDAPATADPGCAAILCLTGTKCMAGPNGNAECVPIADDPPMDAPPTAPADCATVLCRANTTCQATKTGVECVPIETKPDACANAGSCPTDFVCTPANGGVLCLPSNGNTGVAGTKLCSNIICPSNTVCNQRDAYATCMVKKRANPCVTAGSCPDDLFCTLQNGGVMCLPANGNTGVAGTKLCSNIICPSNTTCDQRDGSATCVAKTADSKKPDPKRKNANLCATAGTCPDQLLCTPAHGGVLCLPANGNTGVAGTKLCANIICPSNTTCDQRKDAATCVPKQPDPCAAAGSCPAGLSCTPNHGGVICLPANGNAGVAGTKLCSNIICPSNTRCAQEPEFATCVFAKPAQGR